jgi:pimeloyl-ACP methyl ester carboxylesterase
MSKLYCLSGLGADKRFFRNLEAEGIEFVHIEWIQPLESESLENYARRLFEENIKEENYRLIGLSFGGMIAQEFAKIQKPSKLILLSTILGNNQLPWYMKTAGSLGIHKRLSDRILKSNNRLSRFLFGVNDPEIEILFQEILDISDPEYLRWAMGAVLKWENKVVAESLAIHGTKDRLLPKRKYADHKIESGGHLMLINKSEQIADIIKNYLSENN